MSGEALHCRGFFSNYIKMPFRPGIQYYNYRSVRSDESKEEDLTSTVNRLLIDKLLDDEKDKKSFQNFTPGEVDEESEDEADSDIKVACSLM